MSCLARETSPPASKQRIKGAGGVTRSCVAAAGREEGLGLRAQSNLCVEACRAQRLLSRRGRLESSNLDSEARGDVTRAAVAGPLERTRLPARCARTGGSEKYKKVKNTYQQPKIQTSDTQPPYSARSAWTAAGEWEPSRAPMGRHSPRAVAHSSTFRSTVLKA